MNERMRFNPAEAAAAGAADAQALLLVLATAKEGDSPAGLLNDALAEIIGLAADNRIDECSARLQAFCNVLGPVVNRAVHLYPTPNEHVRIAGAKECVSALAKMEEAAEADYHDATVEAFYAKRASETEGFLAELGSMTPRQEGIVLALAEYVHDSITTGRPDLERWMPVVAMTADEIQAEIDLINQDDSFIEAACRIS